MANKTQGARRRFEQGTAIKRGRTLNRCKISPEKVWAYKDKAVRLTGAEAELKELSDITYFIFVVYFYTTLGL